MSTTAHRAASVAPPSQRTETPTGPLLSRVERFWVRTERAQLKTQRLGVFDGSAVELVELNAGQSYAPQAHERAARLQVVAGSGAILLGGALVDYRADDVFEVPEGMSVGFCVNERTALLSYQDASPRTHGSARGPRERRATPPRVRRRPR